MGPLYFSCDFWLNYVMGRAKFLGLKSFWNFHVMAACVNWAEYFMG
jgi:hypothetical protein